MNDYLTVREAADRKGVSPTAVYKAIEEKRLNSERVFGRLVLKIEDVDKMEFGSYAGVKRVSKPRGQRPSKDVPSSSA